MPEYGWSRMFLNMLGFLICLNKNKYGWISLKYARICLKCKVKDTIKLLLKLDSIYKRERDTCRTVSNVQDGTFVKRLHMVLWIYFELCDRNMPGFWMCQGYTRFWICRSMFLNNARLCLNMPETEPKITLQVAFIDT